MASKSDEGGGGCAVIVAVAIVVAIIFWGVSGVGHLLGLTPTANEATDRPEGWVSRHYQGVVLGYVLTILFLATLAILVWLGLRTLSDAEEDAERARHRLRQVAWAGGALVLAIIALPIGKRGEVRGNVPQVVGLNAAQAESTLEKADLGANFEASPLDEERCKVFRQNPEADAELDPYEEVDLQCRVRIPRLKGRKADLAESTLGDYGLEAYFKNEPSDFDLARCRVARQSRRPSAPPGSKVTLRLRCKKPAPEPPAEAPRSEAEENCDESYEPCVPPFPPDVDCADVDGPVAVTGSDPHGLDRDGDGSACE